MSGYKVRLDDGSEIGPLDLASLRSWFSDGLINPESLILAPGSRRWTRLRQTIDIKAWGGTTLRSKKRKTNATESKAQGRGSRTPSEPLVDRLRLPLAGSLFIACAALAGFWVLRPERLKAALNEWPWVEIGLAFLALGLALFVRKAFMRAVAFLVVTLAAVATLSMAGVLFVQKAPLPAYLVLGSGVVILLGFLATLEGRTGSWLRTVLGSLAVVGGLVGVAWFGFVPSDNAESAVRQWALPESDLTDTQAGVRLRLPDGWRLVKPGAPFLSAPEGVIARVARLDATAFGYLTAQTAPRGMILLEPLVDIAIVTRRNAVPTLRNTERSALDLGGLSARRVLGESGDASSPTRELIEIWRDGYTIFTIVGWGKAENAAELGTRFDGLLAGFESLGGSGKRLADAVQKATAEVPFVSAVSAERIMSMSEAGVLEPPEVFKRAQVLAGKGIPRLGQAEVRELQTILDQAYRAMDRRDRARLAAYLGQVRAGRTTEAAADGDMCTLMSRSLAMLPETAHQRLEALYEKAINVALDETAAGAAN